MLMPTPSGRISRTTSNTTQGTPICCSVSAVASPPIPPPAMRTSSAIPVSAGLLPGQRLVADGGEARHRRQRLRIDLEMHDRGLARRPRRGKGGWEILGFFDAHAEAAERARI